MKAKFSFLALLLLVGSSTSAFAQFSGGLHGVQPTNNIVWDSGNSAFQAYQAALQSCTNSLNSTGNEVAFKMCLSDHGFGPNGLLIGGSEADYLTPQSTHPGAGNAGSSSINFAPRGSATICSTPSAPPASNGIISCDTTTTAVTTEGFVDIVGWG